MSDAIARLENELSTARLGAADMENRLAAADEGHRQHKLVEIALRQELDCFAERLHKLESRWYVRLARSVGAS